MSKTRIAIFQYQWLLQSYSRDFALALAAHGYVVDFFVDHLSTSVGYIDLNNFSAANLSVHVTERPGRWPLLRRIVSKAARVLRKAAGMTPTIVNRRSLKEAEAHVAAHKDEYLAFVGIEKRGLIWAGLMGERFNVPWLYYSLELHFVGDGSYGDGLGHVFPVERRYYRGARATIIQDEQRADVLMRLNGRTDQDMIYMPVSMPGAARRERARHWHRKYGLGPDAKVLLYFGTLCLDSRHLDRACEALGQDAPGDFDIATVFHGRGKQFLPQEEGGRKRVFLSSELVPESGIAALVASADIGLSLYDNDSVNNRLTAFSSQKVALYLQCGVPIISYRNESYEQLFSRVRCGEMIETMDDLPAAIAKILADYDAYREAAFEAFEMFYSHDRNIGRVVSYLARMAGDPRALPRREAPEEHAAGAFVS